MQTVIAPKKHVLPFARQQLLPTVLLRHIVTILLLLFVLYPVIWMVFASFGPSSEVFSRVGPLRGQWTLSNYPTGWALLPGVTFTRIFANSLMVSVLAVLGNVVSCTMAAYAFARLKFRLRGALFAVMLGTILLPYQVVIVPQYILFHKIGWVGNFWPLIVPPFLAINGFYTFLMVQFIRGVPHELDEAAAIDGANHFYIFTRVIVPLALPAMATVALFAFVASWNDLLGPLLYLTTPDKYTVPLGLSTFINSGGTGEASAWGPLFAMAVCSLGPVVGVFLAAQRFLAQGIATTGLR
jgi:multiple sugar transport system permease protein